MKITFIILLVLSAIFSAKAQTNLSLSYVCYPTINHKNPPPLQSGIPHLIRFYMTNFGDGYIQIKSYKAFFSFGENSTKIIGYFANQYQFQPWNGEVFDRKLFSNSDPYKDISFSESPSASDSIDMIKGNVTFYLSIKYWDSPNGENRIYTTIVTLRDHLSPATLTDHLIFREDKKEGN